MKYNIFDNLEFTEKAKLTFSDLYLWLNDCSFLFGPLWAGPVFIVHLNLNE